MDDQEAAAAGRDPAGRDPAGRDPAVRYFAGRDPAPESLWRSMGGKVWL